MVATLMVDAMIMKIHKNLPLDIPNIFPIPTFYSLIEKLYSQIIFCMVAILTIHPRIMKIHKNLPGDGANNFPHQQNIILPLRNCTHKKFFVWWSP